MESFLYNIVAFIARIHTYILTLNDQSENSLTDKELHFIIVGIFLICARERARGSKDAILAFSCGTICHVCLMVLLNSATRNNNLIIFNYAVVSLFILFLYIFFIKRRN